ncbi:MAG: glucodextranase DOMON-like domain-containing protein [Candidatus Wallbacteria bacterium]|nr:glucodextranase DOMON-like domain-containing protein [Candidatus Wallbacteria bacterium]
MIGSRCAESPLRGFPEYRPAQSFSSALSICSILLIFLIALVCNHLYAGEKLSLAIVWHQHQPSYYNPADQRLVLPWVRLHAAKDYYDMAKVLEQFPSMEVTINLVPVLIEQLEMYLYEGREDYLLHLHRKPVSELNREEKRHLINRCFDISWDNVIKKYPYYLRLLTMREETMKQDPSAGKTLLAFSNQDLLDLQVWFNLAWIDPYFHESAEPIKCLIEKGRNFTPEDLKTVLDFQFGIMRQIIPLHRRLMQRGQIELITTPYYHPILPLLCNAADARTAMPGVDLPEIWDPAVDIASLQVEKAVAFFQSRFGEAPAGMWPAEGSLSYACLPLFQKNGIHWIATDEKILSRTIGVHPSRTEGKLDNPTVFATPYRIVLPDSSEITVIFRDTYLSDKVGFDYSGLPPADAVAHLVAYLQDIHAKTSDDSRNYLVSIVLDGENAWENYPNDGHDFFELLYSTLESLPWLKTTRINQFVKANIRSLPVLNTLWPGSWINKDYSTWIGEADENLAWSYTFKAYRTFKELEHALTGEVLTRSKEALMAAFGSDWYWWYGKDQESGNDQVFDLLFREHLKNFYRALEIDIPSELNLPVTAPEGSTGRKVQNPSTPLIDGTRDSCWDTAGGFDLRQGGVMQKSLLMDTLYYTYDTDNLYLALPAADNNPERITVYGRSGSRGLTGPARGLDFLYNFRILLFPSSGKADFLPDLQNKGSTLLSAGTDFIEIAVPLTLFQDNSCLLRVAAGDAENPEAADSVVPLFISWPVPEREICSFTDAGDDDYGSGSLVYPENFAFQEGCFDLKGLKIAENDSEFIIYIELQRIDNPWNSTAGFSVQTIDVYFCAPGGIIPMLPGRRAQIAGGWKHCIVVEGWESRLMSQKGATFEEITRLTPSLSHDGNHIRCTVAKKLLDNPGDFSIAAVVLGQDGYADEFNLRVREVQAAADEWKFGGGIPGSSAVIDLLDPEGDQKKQLTPEDGVVTVHPVEMRR